MYCSDFPGGSEVKNPPAHEEPRVRFLGQEHPMEEEMAAHASILAWEIPWTGAWQAAAHGVPKSQTWLRVSMHTCTCWGSRSTGNHTFCHRDLVESNQFSSYPMATSFFLKSVSCRLLSCFINAGKIRRGWQLDGDQGVSEPRHPGWCLHRLAKWHGGSQQGFCPTGTLYLAFVN